MKGCRTSLQTLILALLGCMHTGVWAWTANVTATYAVATFTTGSTHSGLPPYVLTIRSTRSESDRAVQCTISSHTPLTDQDCVSGSVAVYSGSNITDGLLIGSYCGQLGQEIFYASSNSMFVVVLNNVSLTISYVTQNSCGADILTSGRPYYLRTPGYPNAHDTGIGTDLYHCNWYIATTPDQHLVLNLSLPSANGRPHWSTVNGVGIYDIEDDNKYSSKRRRIIEWRGSDDKTFITFTNFTQITVSGQLLSYYGLQVAFSAQPATPCLHIIDVTVGSNGTIVSDGYPSSINELQVCRWVLRTNNTKHVFSLTVLDADLDNSIGCTKDVVNVYVAEDYSTDSLSRWCGSSRHAIEVYTPSLMIELRTGLNHDRSYKGLNLQYQVLDEPLRYFTSLMATTERQNLHSLNYPQHYPSYIKQKWRLTATDPINVIKMNLLRTHLDSNFCQSGYIIVYDGQAILHRQCSSQTMMLQSSGPSATIVFVAEDNAVAAQGFFLEYWEGQYSLEVQASATHQSIRYPLQPGHYKSGLDVVFTIHASLSYHQVGLRFINVDVKCPDDSVDIYDGEIDQNGRTMTFCGQTDRSYLSTHNMVSVRLRTKSDLGTGINFTYQDYFSTGCQDKVEELVSNDSPQTLLNPGSPDNYYDLLECRWRIQCHLSSEHIELKIDVYNIVTIDPNICTTDYLTVYNGYDTSNQRFPRICGRNKSQTIVSYNNYLYLEFITDRLYTGQGFTLSYRTMPGAVPEERSSPNTVAIIGGITAAVIIIVIIAAFIFIKYRKRQPDDSRPGYAVSFQRSHGEPSAMITEPSPPNVFDPPPPYMEVSPDSRKNEDLPPSYAEALQAENVPTTTL